MPPTGIQVNRTASGVVLPPAVSNEIWQTVQNSSVITQVSRRIPITGPGVTIPMITGDAVADWVAETGEKPISRPALSNKTVTPYKLALIVPFSDEFRRDLATLYSALIARLPNAIAKKFDQTVLGYSPSPGSGFDTLAGITEIPFNGVASVAAAAESVSLVEDAEISHTLSSTQMDFVLAEQLDSEGRPLFPSNDAIYNRFGGSVVRNKHIYDATAPTIGFVGDFSGNSVWGAVGGISVSMSDQATINDGGSPLNLWQRNMFAIRVEATMSFGLRDADAFVRYTGADS